jgi:glyoxylase-like metal-dependent hydrolase (beta-lactamase superfamily II)
MVRRVYEGRVQFHDGDAQLMPGVSLHLIGGHTMGLQVARVERPFPIVWSVADMVDGYRRLRALAESPAHVIPGHDPLVLQRYPAPAKALEGVVARLD